MALYVGNTRRKPMIGGNRYKIVVPPPYDAKIEYLQSTGTQYININVKTKSTIVYEVTGIFTSTEDVDFGAHWTSSYVDYRFYFGIYNSKFLVGCGANKFEFVGNADLLEHTFVIDGSGSGSIDGVSVTLNPWLNTYTSQYFYLFGCCKNGSVSKKAKYKLISSRIYDNGVLVRDYIPVRVGQVGYLYDKVSGELFGNIGTGSFTLGSDVTI